KMATVATASRIPAKRVRREEHHERNRYQMLLPDRHQADHTKAAQRAISGTRRTTACQRTTSLDWVSPAPSEPCVRRHHPRWIQVAKAVLGGRTASTPLQQQRRTLPVRKR